jgi:uncharacterized cupredoxin-like copper-binding protein
MRTALIVVAALVAAGCSTGSGTASRGGATVHIAERDFAISAPAEVRAGEVRLAIRNRGPVAHELIFVKADGSPLPLRGDGLTVDEDAVEPRTAATLEPQPAGRQTVLRAHLAPGRYELFCNMSGHYLGGMHTQLVVR